MKKCCRWHKDCYGCVCGMDITRGEEVLRVARRSVWMEKYTETALEEASQVARRLLCQTWPQGGTTDSDTVSVSELTRGNITSCYSISPPAPSLQVCLRAKV